MSAAVSDFRPQEVAEYKIKRSGDNMLLNLVPNPDIAAELGKMKRPNQLLVGFALETNNEVANAQKKLESKNLDFIVLNSLAEKGAGFMSDTNKISIISRKNKIDEFPLKSKALVAGDIVDYMENLMIRNQGHTL